MNNSEQTDNTIQIKSLFYQCIAKWYWFVISVGLVLCLAVFYLLKTTPVYTRSAKVLIKSDSKGGSSGDVGDFSDLGLLRSGVNINNELKTMQSIDVMTEVVRRLHLDMTYTQDGLFHSVLLYDKTLPVTVDLVGAHDNLSAKFDMKLDKNTVTLSEFESGKDELAGTVKARLGDTVSTPIGLVCVSRNETAQGETSKDLIHVSRSTINGAARSYASRVHIALADKNTDVLALSVEDINVKRGDDILNMLISVYNGNWLKDKNQITVSTSMFIDERLQVIEQELGTVDNDISSYKSENLLPDVSAVSNMYLNQNTATNAQITSLSNQLSITRYIRNYLTNETIHNQLLPVNTGISGSIEGQIANYNTMMLRRNSLVASSSEHNPIVIDIDEKLNALRQAIITSIDNEIATLNTQIANYQGTERLINARLAANPAQAKYLLSVERQQKVKESLYLFLLQKREENELSQAFTAYNTRVIEHPNGSGAPTKPRRSMILLAALFVGIAIPIGILILREYLNTTVRSRKDLEKLTMPFIGEIPLSYSAEEEKKKIKKLRKLLRNKKKKGIDEEQQQGFGGVIVVEHGNRDAINEAFRVLRTNLEFMTKGNESNVIMFTSFNPGSGKSFITMNTAITLAIKKKKILLIDGDLRHASLSAYIFSPKRGIANFLGGQETDVHDVIVKSEEYPTLNYLPVGTIPPNPTELLETELFGETINQLRKEYEYVLIDCPPIDIVADPQIISSYVDRTIFVVRAGLLERSLVPEIEELHTSHKFNNLCLILNGTVNAGARYGYGHYGYKYGYGHYGYHSNGYYGYYHKDTKEK